MSRHRTTPQPPNIVVPLAVDAIIITVFAVILAAGNIHGDFWQILIGVAGIAVGIINAGVNIRCHRTNIIITETLRRLGEAHDEMGRLAARIAMLQMERRR
jgi:hypothetical protein